MSRSASLGHLSAEGARQPIDVSPAGLKIKARQPPVAHATGRDMPPAGLKSIRANARRSNTAVAIPGRVILPSLDNISSSPEGEISLPVCVSHRLAYPVVPSPEGDTCTDTRGCELR